MTFQKYPRSAQNLYLATLTPRNIHSSDFSASFGRCTKSLTKLDGSNCLNVHGKCNHFPFLHTLFFRSDLPVFCRILPQMHMYEGEKRSCTCWLNWAFRLDWQLCTLQVKVFHKECSLKQARKSFGSYASIYSWPYSQHRILQQSISPPF